MSAMIIVVVASSIVIKLHQLAVYFCLVMS